MYQTGATCYSAVVKLEVIPWLHDEKERRRSLILDVKDLLDKQRYNIFIHFERERVEPSERLVRDYMSSCLMFLNLIAGFNAVWYQAGDCRTEHIY